jgi:multiple sugar transport system permease protein
VTSAATTGLGTLYALLLNQPIAGRAIIRAASLLPWILPSTVTACLWTWLFHGQYGVINAGLLATGVIDRPFFFLSSAWGAMLAIVVAKVWLSTPLVMLFVLAALQDLPHDQVEAARLDGAGDIAVVRHVVVPHIRRTLLVVLILQALANLQKFDLVYAMTAGGPVRATMLLSLEVYNRAFDRWDVGMAAAIGVIWFATIAVMSFHYLRIILGRMERR